ncbi:MAG: GyrI-like domain-containing protein [Anaerolinea sp.]|nr:GyrI-like domain-containing protein [Anaerolinea sp.]
MITHDLKQELAAYLKPSAKAPQTVDLPPFQFLMIDGHGDPNTAPSYKDAVSALYSAAYTIKFHMKKQRGIDFPVMALEGLWWAADMDTFLTRDKSEWDWTMMILMPEVVTAEIFAEQVAAAAKKKPNPALDRLRLETYHEGLSAQIMHVGTYDAEAPTIARLHEYISASGHQLTGKHHELYLNDPAKTAPDKLKTIIRQLMAHS